MLQTKLDSRDQEAELIPGIIARTFKSHRVEISLLPKRSHRIRDLNLPNSAGFRLFNLIKDVRRKDVTADDCQVRWRLGRRRLFYHVLDAIDAFLNFITSRTPNREIASPATCMVATTGASYFS